MKINPSNSSQDVIVRTILFDDLNSVKHIGIKLGDVVLVPPSVIGGEINRRIRNEGDKRILDHYQGFI